MYVRHCKHFMELNENVHNNKHLQSSWNKYGKDAFEFNVIEYCSIDNLDEREKYWIVFFDSNNKSHGYNIRLYPYSNRGLKWSDEHREKMNQIINKKDSWYKNHKIPRATLEKAWQATRNKIWSDEQRQNHSKILKGTKVKDTSKMKIAQTGENNGSHKLSEIEVLEIINLLNYGLKVVDISKVYNVKSSNISLIKNKRSWKHVDRDSAINTEYLKNGLEKVNEYFKFNENNNEIA